MAKDYPTYSLEYSYKYKHSYWIAYRFDNTTGGNVGRNEAYKPDPELPSICGKAQRLYKFRIY